MKGLIERASNGVGSVRFERRCHRKELEARVEGTADSGEEWLVLAHREI